MVSEESLGDDSRALRGRRHASRTPARDLTPVLIRRAHAQLISTRAGTALRILQTATPRRQAAKPAKDKHKGVHVIAVGSDQPLLDLVVPALAPVGKSLTAWRPPRIRSRCGFLDRGSGALMLADARDHAVLFGDREAACSIPNASRAYSPKRWHDGAATRRTLFPGDPAARLEKHSCQDSGG
jgi:hypothetical protein